MISFGLRWRLAQVASNFTRQVATGVMATVVVSFFFQLGSHPPVPTAPEPKFTLRIEPQSQLAVVARPLIQQASEAVEIQPAPIAPTHVAKSVSHKPRMVAMLPPVRPREPAEIVEAASTPVEASGWGWLASSRAGVDVTVAALDTSRRWALEGGDLAKLAAFSATTTISQMVRFGP